MPRRQCPPDCEHCERIAEDRADGSDRSQEELDYEADRAADRYERYLDRMWE